MDVDNDDTPQENYYSDSEKEDEPDKEDVPNLNITADQNDLNSKQRAVLIKSESSNLTANPIVVAIHDKSLISNIEGEKNFGKKMYYRFKRRERNLVPREKRIFLSICQNHPEIHNNALDMESLTQRKKAWEEIHKKFITVCPESNDRTVKFLQGCWKRLKGELKNASKDFSNNLDEEIDSSPAPNTIYVIDTSVVSLANTDNNSPHPVPTIFHTEENVSAINTSEINEDTASSFNALQPKSTVQASETPEKAFSTKTLQRKALEVALEAEKVKLEAYKFQKEAQRYAMMAEKERFETELLNKEAARLALKRERDYF